MPDSDYLFIPSASHVMLTVSTGRQGYVLPGCVINERCLSGGPCSLGRQSQKANSQYSTRWLMHLLKPMPAILMFKTNQRKGQDGFKKGDSIQHVPFSLKYTPSSLILACYCPFSSEVPTSAALTGSAEQCCHTCGTAGHSASDSTMLNGILAFVLPQQDWLIGLGHERIFSLLFLLWIMPSERQ